MTITKDEYCISVCGGKCCRLVKIGTKVIESKCPKLSADNKCTMHDAWKNNTCNFSYRVVVNGVSRQVHTTNIEYAIENDLLPKEVLETCCYNKPELLNEY